MNDSRKAKNPQQWIHNSNISIDSQMYIFPTNQEMPIC